MVKSLLQKGADPNARVAGVELNYTALIQAVSEGHVDVAEALLRHGADPYLEDKNHDPALVHAGTEAMIRLLLSWKVPIDSVNSQGTTSLFRQIRFAKPGEIATLLKCGADPNQRDEEGCTPIMFAASADSIRELQEGGADINAQDNAGATALLRTLEEIDRDITPLLDAGANVKLRNKEGESAFLLAARRGKKEQMKALLDHGANANDTDNEGTTALMIAAGYASMPDVEWMLSLGADPATRDHQGKTAIHYAAGASRNAETLADWRVACQEPKAVLELLQAKGATLDALDDNGKNAIYGAVESGYLETIRYLREKKLDLNLPAKDGTTPLHRALTLDHFTVYNDVDYEGKVHLLIDTSLGVDAADTDGRTPLLLAVERMKADFVHRLLEKGASADYLSKSGVSPLLLAASSMLRGFVPPKIYGATVAELAAKSRKVDQQDADGMTALMWAAAANVPEAVEALLQRKASLELRSKDGRTALMWAAAAGAQRTIPILRKHGADLTAKDQDGRTAADWAKWMNQTNAWTALEAREP